MFLSCVWPIHFNVSIIFVGGRLTNCINLKLSWNDSHTYTLQIKSLVCIPNLMLPFTTIQKPFIAITWSFVIQIYFGRHSFLDLLSELNLYALKLKRIWYSSICRIFRNYILFKSNDISLTFWKNHQTFLITFRPYKLSYSIGMHWSWFLVFGWSSSLRKWVRFCTLIHNLPPLFGMKWFSIYFLLHIAVLWNHALQFYLLWFNEILEQTKKDIVFPN